MNLDGVSWMLLDLIETCLHVQRVRCEALNSGWAGVALQGLSGLCLGENVVELLRDVLHRPCLSGLDLPGENISANLGTQVAKPAKNKDCGSFVLVAHSGFQRQPNARP